MPTREELILAQLPQVRKIAGFVGRTNLPQGIDLDDLIAAGHVGLLQAVDRFQPERGLKLATYCEHRIRGEMLDMIRARCGRRGQRTRISVPKDDLFYESVRCPAHTPEQLSSTRSTRARLEWAMEKLPKRQRDVVRLIFFEELMGPAVALQLDIHESRVSQLKRDALAHLRDLLATKP